MMKMMTMMIMTRQCSELGSEAVCRSNAFKVDENEAEGFCTTCAMKWREPKLSSSSSVFSYAYISIITGEQTPGSFTRNNATTLLSPFF